MQLRVLKGMQDRVVTILAPLSKLLYTMEEEINSNPVDDETLANHNEIYHCLSKQYFWLVKHAIHWLAYQRRKNILSTLIDNNTKVREILREQAENLDATENIYLVGEQFDETLAKIISVKHKSKLIFTGLQKRPGTYHHTASTNAHQPF